jgi:hypothetical protein
LLKALRSLDARIESVKIQRRLPSANGEELILATADGKQIQGCQSAILVLLHAIVQAFTS